MRETAQTWAARVSAWRESGLTSERFSEERGFRANALRNWAWRLGKTKPRRKRTVRFARVVRVPAPAPAQETPTGITTEAVDAGVAVEVGAARIVVRAGFDRATLAALLDVLATHGGAR